VGVPELGTWIPRCLQVALHASGGMSVALPCTAAGSLLGGCRSAGGVGRMPVVQLFTVVTNDRDYVCTGGASDAAESHCWHNSNDCPTADY
jgi:hypothetical protein